MIASPTRAPQDTPARTEGNAFASRSTNRNRATRCAFSSLYRSNSKADRAAPRAQKRAAVSGSIPPAPAPWTTDATVESLRRFAAFRTGRTACRAWSGVNFSFFPRPTTRTRGEERPRGVRRERVSPSFPAKSPSRTAAAIAPPIAASTAAAAPPGRFAPSNRFTTSMSALTARMSPETQSMRIVTLLSDPGGS